MLRRLGQLSALVALIGTTPVKIPPAWVERPRAPPPTSETGVEGLRTSPPVPETGSEHPKTRRPTSETGIASWYGQWHHERRIASGDVFDMAKLTAAQRTLPLGSRVRVTNANGRSVEVHVNDRGPAVRAGRSISHGRPRRSWERWKPD